MLKKEVEYFGDIVILPFMDRYELVVLKTIAICGFGVLTISALITPSLIKSLLQSLIRISKLILSLIVVTLKESDYDSLKYLSFQVQNVTAPYIMKCDDDTFIRLESILKEIDGVSPEKSLYMGNLNLRHRPLRNGKWAVTWEVQWLVFFACIHSLV